MRFRDLLFAAALLILPLPTAAVGQVPAYKEVVVPYAIEGRTVAELIASMKANGPKPKAGAPQPPGDAFTIGRAEPQFNYTYKTQYNSTRCSITSVDLTLIVTIHIPEWRKPADGSPALMAEWDRFRNDVLTHERAHAAISQKTAAALVPVLLATPAAANCDQLKLDLRARARTEIEAHDAAQRQFDVKEGSCRLRTSCLRDNP